MGGSGHSNEEEHQKPYNADVNDYYAPFDESPHKRANISALYYYNGGLDGSEHRNEEEDQTTEFSVGNYCDASFDETPY